MRIFEECLGQLFHYNENENMTRTVKLRNDLNPDLFIIQSYHTTLKCLKKCIFEKWYRMTWGWVNKDTVFIVWRFNHTDILDFISCPRIFHDVLNKTHTSEAEVLQQCLFEVLNIFLLSGAGLSSLDWTQGSICGISWRTYRWIWERRTKKMSENSLYCTKSNFELN